MTIRSLAALGLITCSLSACIMLPPPHHAGGPRPSEACGADAPPGMPNGPRHAGPPPRDGAQARSEGSVPSCEAPPGQGFRGGRFAPGTDERAARR